MNALQKNTVAHLPLSSVAQPFTASCSVYRATGYRLNWTSTSSRIPTLTHPMFSLLSFLHLSETRLNSSSSSCLWFLCQQNWDFDIYGQPSDMMQRSLLSWCPALIFSAAHFKFGAYDCDTKIMLWKNTKNISQLKAEIKLNNNMSH